jgi:hypothetical protein
MFLVVVKAEESEWPHKQTNNDEKAFYVCMSLLKLREDKNYRSGWVGELLLKPHEYYTSCHSSVVSSCVAIFVFY